MTKMRRAKQMKISAEMLADAIGLPDGCKITEFFRTPYDKLTGTYTLIIEHPSFEELPEGVIPPQVKARDNELEEIDTTEPNEFYNIRAMIAEINAGFK